MVKKTLKSLEEENRQLKEQIKELKKGESSVKRSISGLDSVAVSVISEKHDHHGKVYRQVTLKFNAETGEACVEEVGEKETRREIAMSKCTENLHKKAFKNNGI